jgi:transposase-like protein
MHLTKEQKDEIIKEYLAIQKFDSHTISDLAKKHGITVDELLDIIPL